MWSVFFKALGLQLDKVSAFLELRTLASRGEQASKV